MGRDALLKTLNKGSASDLQQLPTIGEATAANIRKARPFKSAVDLAEVTGIGKVKFAQIIKHFKKYRTRPVRAGSGRYAERQSRAWLQNGAPFYVLSLLKMVLAERVEAELRLRYSSVENGAIE